MSFPPLLKWGESSVFYFCFGIVKYIIAALYLIYKVYVAIYLHTHEMENAYGK